jgi:hypothetical protein
VTGDTGSMPPDTARALKRIAFWVTVKFVFLIALTLAVLRWKGLI